jgi:hypothetical protein
MVCQGGKSREAGVIMTQTPVPGHLLAASLAARLLHDLSGPASGILSGVELANDPDSADLRESAAELTAASARALLEMLEFCSAAYGGGGAAHANQSLQKLSERQVAARKSTLEWSVPQSELPGEVSQALLIMVQIAAGALGARGVVHVAAARLDTGFSVQVRAESARLRVQPEVAEGLSGVLVSSGLIGRWAPAAFLRALLSASGGAAELVQQADVLRLESVFAG